MTNDRRLEKALDELRSILVEGETLEAWAAELRMFAMFHRRVIIAVTTGRFIALRRGLFGGFDITDFRWQDLRDAKLRVGIFGADLHLSTSGTSDLAIEGSPARVLNYTGFRKEQIQHLYRLAQAHDQAWREKRRIREMEELRAKSGGFQFAAPGVSQPSISAATHGDDAVARLQKAKQMLDAKLISDSEYESLKAKIISGV